MSTVFISGVNKGFGLSMLKRFLCRGDYVIGTYRTMSDELKTIAAKYSEQCEYIYMDLNDPDTIDEAIDRISVEKIDYMINNAATSAGV